MIAADSSSLIAFFEGSDGKDAEQVEAALMHKQLILPPIVLSEMLSDSKQPRNITRILLALPVMDILPGFWERAGKTHALLISKKLKARLADTFIAQCCLDHNSALITRDSDFQHFARYCGLKLYH